MARIPLAHAVHMVGEPEEGNRLTDEALRGWTTLGNVWGIGLTHCTLGLIADMAGDAATAVAQYTDRSAGLESAGDAHQAAYYHGFLGVNLWKLGDVPSAVAHVRAGLRTSIAFQDRWLLSMAAQATWPSAGRTPSRISGRACWGRRTR